MHKALVLLLDCLLGSVMAAVLAALRENDVISCLLQSDSVVNSDIDIAFKPSMPSIEKYTL